MKQKSILEMNDGEIMHKVNREMARVLKNVLDPDTKANAKRKIVVTMEIMPNDDRSQVIVGTTVKSVLAPALPAVTGLAFVGNPDTGETMAVEMLPEISGQLDMYGGEEDEPGQLVAL